jgi:hypothetical protein
VSLNLKYNFYDLKMPNSYSIPHLYASGTHYEVGFETVMNKLFLSFKNISKIQFKGKNIQKFN